MARKPEPGTEEGASKRSAPEPTFYLFDGYNLLYAGKFSDPRELEDKLASFVALRGARGIVVFDGAGAAHTLGPLEVRFAEVADYALERLAAELEPYFQEHGQITVTPAARNPHNTLLTPVAPRLWEAQQRLIDPEGDEDFAIFARVDLSQPLAPVQESAPLIELLRVGR